ncbi:MAG: TolB family protein [Spirochaetota bacterium]
MWKLLWRAANSGIFLLVFLGPFLLCSSHSTLSADLFYSHGQSELLLYSKNTGPLHSTPGFGGRSLPDYDVSLDWYSVDTQHFTVIYPKKLRNLALLAAEEAEGVYSKMADWTAYHPSERIPIILTDRSDHANGFVSMGAGGLYITLHSVHPYHSLTSGLDAYKNWYRNLLVHELSHYFHLDQAEGLPAFFRDIFGNIFHPNALTPSFYVEGFATYSETVNEAGRGRGDSPLTDMYVRTAAQNNDLFSLDRASSNAEIWPYWQSKYLFGVSFIHYLTEKYGESKLMDLNRKTSGYPPFCWGIAYNDIYENKPEHHWKQWMQASRAAGENTVKDISRNKTTPTSPLTGAAGHIYSIRFSHSGELLAYSVNRMEQLGGLYLYDFGKKSERCIKKGLYPRNLTFSKDDKTIYYIRDDYRKNVYIEKNIYVLDLKTEKEKKVTKTGNIQGFVYLHEKSMFLACYSTPGGPELALFDSNGNRLPFPAGKNIKNTFQVLESPDLSPDGTQVVFSGKDKNGNRGLYLLDIRAVLKGNCSPVYLAHYLFNTYCPEWVNNSEILFVGDYNGVYNLYYMNLNSWNVKRLTNVVTGVFHPAAGSEGRVAVSEYTHRGYRVSVFHASQFQSFDIPPDEGSEHIKNRVYTGSNAYNLPPDDGSLHTNITSSGVKSRQDSTEKRNQTIQDQPTTITASKKYTPGRWLLPGFWLPVAVAEGIDLGVGFYTAGEDLLAKHSYSAAVMYDLFDRRVESSFSYRYNFTRFSTFGKLFLAQPRVGTEQSDAAFYPGITLPVLKQKARFALTAGLIAEQGFAGPSLSLYLDTSKSPVDWIGPQKGLAIENRFYYNLSGGSFLIQKAGLSLFQRVFKKVLFRLSFNNMAVLKGTRRVISGGSTGYLYLPLEGLHTHGYPDPVAGNLAAGLLPSVSFRVADVQKGCGSFPLFFKDAVLSFFSDHSMVFSNAGSSSETQEFVITGKQDFLDDPLGHIRTSVGSEVSLNFKAGYRLPFSFVMGYVYAVSPTGQSGLYLGTRVNVSF